MDNRLPPREGEWIDRSQPIEFRFEGRKYQGFAGDVLSSALWANDVRTQGRSFKYHRPRGIYSLAGHDANVMVEDGQRTNIRGDLLPISPGLDVCSVNTAGGVKRDWLNATEWFSLILPVGFYYKAFHTPRRLFPFYENQMRKVAGLGRINREARHELSPKDYAFCDIAIIGAGPAGLSAAVAAGECGARVLVVDDQVRPGGSLNWQPTRASGDRSTLSSLLEQIEKLPNVEVRTGTQAAGCYGDHWIALIDGTRLTKLRARALVVATGCIEQPAVFQNNDLPGVMLGTAAQRLMHLYSVRPFARGCVLAANTDGYRVALDLHEAGVDVGAVVDPRPAGEDSALGQAVVNAGITVHRNSVVVEAIAGRGKRRICGAGVCRLDDDNQPGAGSATTIECDGIAMSVGWTPNSGLLSQAGVRFVFDEPPGQLVPDVMPDGVFAAGGVNGVFGSHVLDDGRRAGVAASAYLGFTQTADTEGPPRAREAFSHGWPIVANPGGKNFVDLDEDLHLADFENAHQEGYDNIELLKRFTTVGMGPSQGKLSNINAVRILARLNGASISETGTTTSRPFYQPVSLSHLAGRRFHPQRRTAMHDWHVERDAEMVHAGAWLRPEFYRRAGQSREECILAEALNVRGQAGLIDVSTLGKIQVCGPDAVSFLERLYTGRFAKQAVGRVRYGLALDETGVIIEDGVIARLGDDRFYVTATSSGAAAFYREMQRWALLWGMNVTLVNSTGHLSAMNLAGPQSREILESLTDLDLSVDAFPYLGLRTGEVAGVNATVMRVGFVGELGFEIHVPASHGLHVWQSIMLAGADVGVRPFGVEAQRLLRLEKGHLIVGQDTDALTNPMEADVQWAIGKNKEFFVGSRSLEILRRKPLKRRLVGLEFDDSAPAARVEECHLIIADGEIVGRVTSIARESTVGRAIALAFLDPERSKVGSPVTIRDDSGQLVQARVASLPFYDPKNLRQM